MWRRLAGPLLALAVVTLSFALLEAGFRVADTLAASRAEESWAVYDEVIGYRLRPGFGDVNDAGLRDHPVPPRSGKGRLLMLGDSLIYNGADVDDTVIGWLRRELARSPRGAAVEVLNAGVRGYTSRQALLWLERYGLALEPDAVGLHFVLNDLHDELVRFEVQDGRIVGQSYQFTEEAARAVDSRLVRLARRSVFLTWCWRRLAVLRHAVEHFLLRDFSFDHRIDFAPAWKEEPWEMVRGQLRALRELGGEHGFEPFVIVYPLADQYRRRYLARDREYVLRPQRRLAELCGDLGIPYLDLYEALDASVFEADDIHLTRAGRRRAAAAIAGWLLDEGLVPDG